MILTLAALVLPKPTPNLVIDGDFSGDPKGFRTDYSLAATLSYCGAYALTDDPKRVHSGGTSMADHTTGRGTMLVMNGSMRPEVTVWAQTVRVRRGRTYDLSLWGASWGRAVSGDAIIDPSPARLRVTVDGKPLATPFAFDERSGQWRRFSASWKADGSKPVEIRIVNENTDCYGNDFALDDLAFVQADR